MKKKIYYFFLSWAWKGDEEPLHTGNESEHGEYGKRIREPGFVNWVHIALLFSQSTSSLNQEFASGHVVNRCRRRDNVMRSDPLKGYVK